MSLNSRVTNSTRHAVRDFKNEVMAAHVPNAEYLHEAAQKLKALRNHHTTSSANKAYIDRALHLDDADVASFFEGVAFFNARGLKGPLWRAKKEAQFWLKNYTMSHASRQKLENFVAKQREQNVPPRSTPRSHHPPQQKWHNVLGVPANAPFAHVKKQYLRMVLKHHPNKGGRKENFVALQNAYNQAKRHHGIR
jgi:hypothetical protein